MTEPVVACTLTAAEHTAQSARWRALRWTREELADGIRLTFEPGAEPELQALVAVERECCAWADWQLDGRVLTVRSTGRGVDALHQMLRA